MFNILYDHQIFESQYFGGISYYFARIINGLDSSFNPTISIRCSGNEYLNLVKNSLYYPVQNKGFFDDFMFGINFPGKSKLFSLRNTLIPYLSASNINRESSLALIRSGNFDIFHPTYYDPYFLEISHRIPYVLTVHDCTHELFPEYFGASDRTHYNKKLTIENASRIIAISESTKKDIIQFYKVEESKVDVVYHGVDIPYFSERDINFSTRLPEQYILYTRQRYHYKNWLFFVRAIKDILFSNKELKLVCTGPTFSKSEKNYLKDLGIENKVIHIETQFKNIKYIYANALAFVFPSLSEGFGLPILEAMSVGCPTLLSDIPVMREIGADAALYFNPKDLNSINTCISAVLSDSELREVLSQKGKCRALEFSWDKTCLQTMEVYKKVLQESK